MESPKPTSFDEVENVSYASTYKTTTILSTKELNSLITESKLDESILEKVTEKSSSFHSENPTFLFDDDENPFLQFVLDEEEIVTKTKTVKQSTTTEFSASPVKKVSGIPILKNYKNGINVFPSSPAKRSCATGAKFVPISTPTESHKNFNGSPKLLPRPISKPPTATKGEQFFSKSEIKPALEPLIANNRPNSLQIPTMAAKCPIARKILFETTNNPKEIHSLQVGCGESVPGKYIPIEVLNTTKSAYELGPFKNISVASQTRPCIVTPISAINSLSVSQNVHRRNLYLFSNQTPSFLRSTASSRGHCSTPNSPVIQELKYLKNTSLLPKKYSSLPSINSSTSCPQKIARKLQGTTTKLAFGSPIPECRPNSKSSSIKSPTKLNSPSKGKFSSGQMPSTQPTPWPKISPVTSTSPEMFARTKSTLLPNSYVYPGSEYYSSFLNSSTYISPTPMRSFSTYANKFNNSYRSVNKPSAPRKLARTKVTVTSISPTDQKFSPTQPSYSFQYYNVTPRNTAKTLLSPSPRNNWILANNKPRAEELTKSNRARPAVRRPSYSSKNARTRSLESGDTCSSSISPTTPPATCA